MPRPIRTVFELLARPALPREWRERFHFADDYADLGRWLPPAVRPRAWGGRAGWDAGRHVALSCLREGTWCTMPACMMPAPALARG